jgi:hypothetical protein
MDWARPYQAGRGGTLLDRNRSPSQKIAEKKVNIGRIRTDMQGFSSIGRIPYKNTNCPISS